MTEWIYDPKAGRCRKTDGGQAMSDDRIEEIRARHRKRSEIDQSGCYRLDGFTYMGSLSQSQEDVATLLAEVERLTGKLKLVADALNETISKYHEVGDQNDRLDAENERLRVKNERLRERLLQERAALVLDEIGAALERERVLRAALTDMMSGWRYIRDTYGDLAGVGWDRVEQKAREALEGKP